MPVEYNMYLLSLIKKAAWLPGTSFLFNWLDQKHKINFVWPKPQFSNKKLYSIFVTGSTYEKQIHGFSKELVSEK